MKILNDDAEKFVLNMIKANLSKIDVKSGKCRFNFRCQMNTVHEALNHKDDRIAMCFYIDGNYPIIHFLNVDSDGNFIDNTLGRWSERYVFYFIRFVDKTDFFNVNDIFAAYRKDLKSKLPFLIRIFSDIEF